MTEPRTDRDVEQALAGWMDHAAPNRAPTRLLEGAFMETMGSRQVRVYPWHRIGPLWPDGWATRSAVRLTLVALVVMVLAGMVFGIVGGGLPLASPPIASPSPSASPTPSLSSSPTLPSPIRANPEGTIAIEGPMAMVADGMALWVLAPGRLDRIDPAAGAVSGSVTIGATTDQYEGLAANANGVWATDSTVALLDRVDPNTLKVTSRIPAGKAPKGVLATADGVWVADVHGGTVLGIDQARNKVGTTTTVGPAGTSGPNWLASGFGSTWVGIPNTSSIARIDAATNLTQATIPAPDDLTPCGGLAVGETAIWITSCSVRTTIGRIDPASNTVVATVDLHGNGYNPALINGAPWISVDTGDSTSGYIVRIDAATNSIDRVLVPGTTFGGGGDIVVAAGSVWVVDGYNGAVLRLPLAAFAP